MGDHKLAHEAFPDGSRVFVGNLSNSTTINDVMQVFSRYGDIQNRVVRVDHFVFLQYKTRAEAMKAISEQHGRQLNGSRMWVRVARGRKLTSCGTYAPRSRSRSCSRSRSRDRARSRSRDRSRSRARSRSRSPCRRHNRSSKSSSRRSPSIAKASVVAPAPVAAPAPASSSAVAAVPAVKPVPVVPAVPDVTAVIRSPAPGVLVGVVQCSVFCEDMARKVVAACDAAGLGAMLDTDVSVRELEEKRQMWAQEFFRRGHRFLIAVDSAKATAGSIVLQYLYRNDSLSATGYDGKAFVTHKVVVYQA